MSKQKNLIVGGVITLVIGLGFSIAILFPQKPVSRFEIKDISTDEGYDRVFKRLLSGNNVDKDGVQIKTPLNIVAEVVGKREVIQVSRYKHRGQWWFDVEGIYSFEESEFNKLRELVEKGDKK